MGAFSSNREIPLRFQLLVELPDDLIGLAAADAHDFSDFCCGDVLSFHKNPHAGAATGTNRDENECRRISRFRVYCD